MLRHTTTLLSVIIASTSGSSALAQQTRPTSRPARPVRVQPHSTRAGGRGGVRPAVAPWRTLVPKAEAADERTKPSRLLEVGRAAGLSGEYAESMRYLGEALRLAEPRGDNAVPAIKLEKARQARRWAALDKSKRAELGEAQTLLKDVAVKGTRQQASLAYNELGVMALDGPQPDARRALSQFEQVDLTAVEEHDRPLIKYNIGRAHETIGDSRAAFEQFAAAPSFRPAVNGAYRVLLKSDWGTPEDATKLTRALIQQGELDLVRPNMWKTAERWKADDRAAGVCAGAVVRFYERAAFTPDQFRRMERPQWEAIESKSRNWDRLSKELELVHLGEFGDVLTGRDPHELLPVLTSAESDHELSAMLKTVADSYYWDEHPAEALARYFAAWRLDPGNTDAALYATILLKAHGQNLDQSNKLLSELIRDVCAQDGAAYDGRDWSNIMRVHVLLAEIFEGADPTADHRRVMFHLDKASNAEGMLLRTGQDLKPSAELRRRLAEACVETDDPQRAAAYFVRAGHLFVEQGRLKEAKDVLSKAEKLGDRLTDREKHAIERLRAEIRRHE